MDPLDDEEEEDPAETFWLIGQQFEFDLNIEPEEVKAAEDDYAVIVNKEPKKFGNGCTCDDCGEIYPYAEANDDGSFRCYSCKKYG